MCQGSMCCGKAPYGKGLKEGGARAGRCGGVGGEIGGSRGWERGFRAKARAKAQGSAKVSFQPAPQCFTATPTNPLIEITTSPRRRKCVMPQDRPTTPAERRGKSYTSISTATSSFMPALSSPKPLCARHTPSTASRLLF